jgi:hypothetical protein
VGCYSQIASDPMQFGIVVWRATGAAAAYVLHHGMRSQRRSVCGRATPFSTLTICATLLGTHRAAPAAFWAQSGVSIVPLPSSFLVVDRPTLHVCLRSGFGAPGFALHVLLGHLGAHSFLGRYAARKSDADVQPYRDFDPVAVPKARNPASARPLALFAPTSNFAALVFTISADVRTQRNYSVISPSTH